MVSGLQVADAVVRYGPVTAVDGDGGRGAVDGVIRHGHVRRTFLDLRGLLASDRAHADFAVAAHLHAEVEQGPVGRAMHQLAAGGIHVACIDERNEAVHSRSKLRSPRKKGPRNGTQAKTPTRTEGVVRVSAHACRMSMGSGTDRARIYLISAGWRHSVMHVCVA